MVTKPKTRAPATHPDLGLQLRPLPTSPGTTEERLQCIEAMGQRITGYVQFMCKVATTVGSSAEAKEKAVLAFYERLSILEHQLRRIQEDFQLG